ncbi:uncharacterized protein DUF998 [Gemmobacter caeni]|jgi:hypothetical protein|uniref:Uncharacterized protein DUF998 n=1 Tax=Gemmobacter caeni TaxID=589035 RepID=A0A2T6B4L7_9RHOB|nr:DUF998 domain-containing protein [Gemmobacter caeni]OJY30139.1 MAG: hypothetical protein BGP11_05645 [Rhodobacterales bacterium 65-51]PTX50973.1 uncharacterized protein DUF998 [Gemmobacter caeni]TWJ00973.1 uncharacterized protein DUF998 [Gemmobacter caeni]
MSSLYLASALAYLAVIILFAALHLRGDYSPIRQALSDYGIGPSHPLFVGYAVAGIAASSLLAAAVLEDGRFTLRAGLCLLGMAALPLGVVAYPTDIEGEPSSRTGRLHLAFAVANFALAYIAIDDLFPDAESLPPAAFRHLLGALYWVVTASLLGVAVCLVHALRHRIFGLLERLYLFSSALWLGLFALGMALAPHGAQ